MGCPFEGRWFRSSRSIHVPSQSIMTERFLSEILWRSGLRGIVDPYDLLEADQLVLQLVQGDPSGSVSGILCLR